MTDEKMMQSVASTLKFIESLKAKTDDELRKIVQENNIEILPMDRKKMLEALFEHFIVGEDLLYYKKYVALMRVKNAQLTGDTLDKLNSLIASISEEYERRKECNIRRNNALNNIDKIQRELKFLPMIRASIAFSHVESSKERFISARTKDGMKRAKLTDEITDIKKKNIIIRALKAGKVKQLQAELNEHNELSGKNVEVVCKDFEKMVKEYCDVLRELFYEMLDNRVIQKSAYMSYCLIAKIGIDYTKEDLGIKIPSDSELKEMDKEKIYSTFIEFAKFPSAAELDSAMFVIKLREFATYYERTVASRAAYKVNVTNNEIARLFSLQKGLVQELVQQREQSEDTLWLDDEKAFTLVYANETGTGKKENV